MKNARSTNLEEEQLELPHLALAWQQAPHVDLQRVACLESARAALTAQRSHVQDLHVSLRRARGPGAVECRRHIEVVRQPQLRLCLSLVRAEE